MVTIHFEHYTVLSSKGVKIFLSNYRLGLFYDTVYIIIIIYLKIECQRRQELEFKTQGTPWQIHLKKLVGLMCQRIPLFLTPFVGGSTCRCRLQCVLGLVTLKGTTRGLMVRTFYSWGVTSAGQDTLPQVCLHNHRHTPGLPALHSDEKAKHGEFHLQKTPSVAPVVLSQYHV